MAMLQPKMAILDETDSGLDIDALKIVSQGINRVCGPEVGVLLVTHYQRILDYVKPDYVHVLVKGRLARSGGPGLALELEQTGYDEIAEESKLVTAEARQS
jgi:Fe-S cluster assembly ATP-binding protein